jgi:hypothetical protein
VRRILPGFACFLLFARFPLGSDPAQSPSTKFQVSSFRFQEKSDVSDVSDKSDLKPETSEKAA